jgi:DNA-binding SARP family transcriptional activator
MAQLRLRMFGSLGVTNAGHPLGPASGQPRRLALLALIARAGDAGISRDQVIACLWPDSDAPTQGMPSIRRCTLCVVTS